MNQAQLLEALAAALESSPGPDDAYTANELEEMLEGRVERKRLLSAIHALWKEGKIEAVKVQRQHPTRLATVPAYRFVA